MVSEIIRIRCEQGSGNWFYATSPDLRGLLVCASTVDGLDRVIPQAISNLYRAREIEVSVIPLDSGDGKWHDAWVVDPV